VALKLCPALKRKARYEDNNSIVVHVLRLNYCYVILFSVECIYMKVKIEHQIGHKVRIKCSIKDAKTISANYRALKADIKDIKLIRIKDTIDLFFPSTEQARAWCITAIARSK
jgi:hypothetical protein